MITSPSTLDTPLRDLAAGPAFLGQCVYAEWAARLECDRFALHVAELSRLGDYPLTAAARWDEALPLPDWHSRR